MKIKSHININPADGVKLVRRDVDTFNLFTDDRIEGVVVIESHNYTAYRVCYINRNLSLVSMHFTTHRDALAYIRRNYAGLIADTYIDAHRRGEF